MSWSPTLQDSWFWAWWKAQGLGHVPKNSRFIDTFFMWFLMNFLSQLSKVGQCAGRNPTINFVKTLPLKLWNVRLLSRQNPLLFACKSPVFDRSDWFLINFRSNYRKFSRFDGGLQKRIYFCIIMRLIPQNLRSRNRQKNVFGGFPQVLVIFLKGPSRVFIF